MAIAAINPKTRDVMLMAERHRLLDRYSDFRPEVRPSEGVETRAKRNDENRAAEDDQLCDCIRAPFKELSHATTIPIIAISYSSFIERRALSNGNWQTSASSPPKISYASRATDAFSVGKQCRRTF